MCSDKPGSSEDAFHRNSFIKSLEKLLCLSPAASSTVLGLEGRWGSGKSFCIHMLEAELRNSPHKPLVLHYDPWILSNIDSLVEGFFTQLGAELNQKSGRSQKLKATSNKFLNVGKALSFVKFFPGSEPWISLIQSGLEKAGATCEALSDLSSMDLREQLADLSKSILAMEKPVIVIIDDIDRLQPEQVRLVFQLVKTVGDLPRVAYLMAYDRNSVVKALHSANIHDGEAYLEKMVQLPVPMPRQALVHKLPYVKSELQTVLRESDMTLSSDDEELLNEALQDTDLLLTLETPRDVKRICNSIRLTLSTLGDEINFTDLVILETIHIRMPKVYEIIVNDHDKFIYPYGSNRELHTVIGEMGEMARAIDDRDTNKDSRLEVVLKMPESEGYNLKHLSSLLRFIFPNLLPHQYDHQIDPKRLRYPDALYKVLHAGKMDFTFNRETAEAFLLDTRLRPKLLQESLERGNLAAFLGSVTPWIGTITPEDVIGLFKQFEGVLSKQDHSLDHGDLCGTVSIFIKNCILALSENEAGKSLTSIFDLSSDYLLSSLILRNFLMQYHLWEDGKYIVLKENDVKRSSVSALPLSYQDINEAIKIWTSAI